MRSVRIARTVVFALALVVAADCRPYTPALPEREASDIALFREVVIAIQKHVGPDSLAINPRPLIADSSLRSARDSYRASVSAADLDSRRAVLRALHVRETSDEGDDPKGCPGVTWAAAPPPAIDFKKTSCPRTRSYVANVALPRPGGAYLPPGYIDEREIGRAKGHVAVRVLLMFRGPEGVVLETCDFVMARDAGGWKLVKSQVLDYVE